MPVRQKGLAGGWTQGLLSGGWPRGHGHGAMGTPWISGRTVGTPEAHSQPVGSGRQSGDCCHGNQGRRLGFFVCFFFF